MVRSEYSDMTRAERVALLTRVGDEMIRCAANLDAAYGGEVPDESRPLISKLQALARRSKAGAARLSR
jgi:hypothetical protein